MMTPLAPHITTFLRERLPRERRASIHTCETYAHAFRLLFEYAALQLKITPSQLTLEQIDAPIVLAFLGHLESTRGNGGATRNARLTAIKSFMHFVEYRVPSALDQVRQILAIPLKKTDAKLVRHLSLPETQAILDAPDPRTRMGQRDRAMLHVCFVGGLRVSELVGLKVEDVSFDPRACIRVLGKGRRERVLPLWKESGIALRGWLAVRGTAADPALFLNARGGVMTRAGFTYVLRQHVRAARVACPSLGEKRVSPHVLRHSCAMMTLQATGDIRKVALWLGHSSLQSTDMYLRADPTQKLDAVSLVTPLPLRKGQFTAPDHLIELLRTNKAAKDYVKPSEGERPWVGPRRRLTVHNNELR
jgi:site-specific recombinase XerD